MRKRLKDLYTAVLSDAEYLQELVELGVLIGSHRTALGINQEEFAKMLKAIHAQENKAAAKEKAKSVISRLREMKLNKAADKLENGLEETLTYMDFPSEHWLRIRTNNVIERVNREIKRRTRVIGTFPDGESALMLVCARLRYIASNDWGKKRYLNMKHLTNMLAEELYCEAKIS